jgi:Uma2 family endonuclease
MNEFPRRYTENVPRSARPMPLITGMRMEREEFLQRWEALPDLKLAELIEGIVFVPSPIGLRHSDYDVQVQLWLATYAAHTPGIAAGTKATCYMLESAPQPDAFLRILPEHGGSTQDQSNFLHGAPELIVEVSESSTTYDFGPKLALYQRAGVREYIRWTRSASRSRGEFSRADRTAAAAREPTGFIVPRLFPDCGSIRGTSGRARAERCSLCCKKGSILKSIALSPPG